MRTRRIAARGWIISAVLLLTAVGLASGQSVPRAAADELFVQVDIKSYAELHALEAAGGTILNCVPGPGSMDVVLSRARLEAVRELGLSITIQPVDLAELLRRERQAGVTLDPFDDFFLGYRQYGHVNQPATILWYLHELASRYPGFATVMDFGTTVEGRAIWGLRIANDAVTIAKPAVLYFAAQHAREWITPAVPLYFATRLLEGYGSDPQLSALVDEVEFYLIPVVNVDGYLYSWSDERFWRKNRRDNGNGTFGVDLNRNWEEGWSGPGSGSGPGSDIYRGPAPFSEPETQALRDFILAHPNLRAMLDIHSYSQLILWPYGYTGATEPNHADYRAVGLAMQSAIRYVHGEGYTSGPVYNTLYPAAGISLDWAWEQAGVLAYTFECRDRGRYGFAPPPEQVLPNAEELFPAMLDLTDSPYVRRPVRYEFPDGVPKTAPVDVPAWFWLQMVAQYEQFIPGSGLTYYRPAGLSIPFHYPIPWYHGGDGDDSTWIVSMPERGCGQGFDFYLSVQTNAGSIVTSPPGAPAELYRVVAATGTETFWAEDMSSNPHWSTEGRWAWGRPGGSGSHNHDPLTGFTGPYVYGYAINDGPTIGPVTGANHVGTGGFTLAPPPYGTPASGDYADDQPALYLTTPPINCIGRNDVRLSYYRWLGVESNASFDEATVEVSPDGVDWTVVWRASATGERVVDLRWTLHELDISDIADEQPAVQIRWGMGPTDGATTFPGWNIDDVELTSAVCVDEVQRVTSQGRRATGWQERTGLTGESQ